MTRKQAMRRKPQRAERVGFLDRPLDRMNRGLDVDDDAFL